MDILCGVDIIEIERIKKAIQKDNGRLISKVFTEAERDYCEKRLMSKHQHYAVRFAAKEAVSKALGTGIAGGLALVDIEVVKDERGKPDIKLHGKAKKIADEMGVKSMKLSLSHCDSYAVANVVCLIEE